MTGFMGYDDERVRFLRQATQRAVAQLDGVRSNDPDASIAMSNVRNVQRALVDQWLPLMEALLSCQALDAHGPVALDAGDLTNSRFAVLQRLYGWSIVNDPLSSASDPTITQDQAQALGWTLSNGQLAELVSNDELKWLRHTLDAIAAQRRLGDAFLSNMTQHGWAQLCNLLGDERIRLVSMRTVEGGLSVDNHTRLADIDAVFAALGATLADARHQSPATEMSWLLTDMHPYGAALLVQHLRLTADELVVLSTELIARYRTGGWADVQRAGPGTADLLMTTMLNTRGAAAVFIKRAVHDPALLFDAAHDSALMRRLVILGTSPAQMSVADAGTVVPDLIRYLRDRYTPQVGFYGQPDATPRALAVDIAAPWLLQFTSVHGTDWGFTSGQGAQLLASIVTDADAFARLAVQRERIADGFRTTITANVADANAARHAVHDLAAVLALIDTLARQQAIAHANEAQQLWDIGFALIASATSMLPGGAAATLGSGAALVALRAVLVREGIAPRSPGRVAHDTLYALDWQTTVAAAAVIAASFDQMRRQGTIPVSTPLPPLPDPTSPNPGAAYSADFEAWLDANELGAQGVLLAGLKQTIASVHEAERNAVDLAA